MYNFVFIHSSMFKNVLTMIFPKIVFSEVEAVTLSLLSQILKVYGCVSVEYVHTLYLVQPCMRLLVPYSG